jgi:hypothetical protein
MLYEPKKDVYEILNTIDGVTVYQNTPEVFKDLPTIVFYIDSNVPEYLLEKDIGYQDIEIVVDIFAKNSAGSGSLLASLEQVMLENDFRLMMAMDVPDENTSHITTRFNFLV